MASGRPKRARKAVVQFNATEEQKEAFAVKAGAGITLGDFEFITTMVRKAATRGPELKTIHRLFFKRAGKARDIRSNILAFSGLTDTSDEEIDRLYARIEAVKMDLLKKIMDILGINRSALSFEDKAATKSNLCDRFIKWLQQPTEPCKGLPKKKTKRKATKKPTAAKQVTKKARKSSAPKDFGLPEDVEKAVREIVESSDVAEITMKAVYAQVEDCFEEGMTKDAKRAVKALVLQVVAEENERRG